MSKETQLLRRRIARIERELSRARQRLGYTELPVYRITTTDGYMADETGSGYSLEPWGGDTDYYTGYDEPVTAIVPDGWQTAESTSGEVLLYAPDGNGYTLDEAVKLGHVRIRD